jgi:hypothetical protein
MTEYENEGCGCGCGPFYCPKTCLERLKKTTRMLIHDIWPPHSEMNVIIPEFEAGVIISRPLLSVT